VRVASNINRLQHDNVSQLESSNQVHRSMPYCKYTVLEGMSQRSNMDGLDDVSLSFHFTPVDTLADNPLIQ
jgi:hypothetical protein